MNCCRFQDSFGQVFLTFHDTYGTGHGVYCIILNKGDIKYNAYQSNIKSVVNILIDFHRPIKAI